MTLRSLVVRWATLFAVIAGCPALAYVIPPPAPLQVQFDTATGALTPSGRLAADRLAVRAAQCGDGSLRVVLSHEPGIPPDQVTARDRVLRQRPSTLGVDAIYVNRFENGGKGARSDVAWALVVSGDDSDCSQVNTPVLQSWAEQLAEHARQPGGQVPVFWSRMSASVRRDELAPILATTSYCAVPGSSRPVGRAPLCVRHPEAFEWLAERAVSRPGADRRRHWLEILWSAADASTLQHWQRRLGIAEVPPDAALRWVPALVASELPWEEIERRLLMPGLMSRVGREELYVRFPVAEAVVQGASTRRRLDALPRLIEAAGAHAEGLYFEIVVAAATTDDDADFDQLMRLLPEGYPTGVWNRHVTELLMIGVSCPGAAPGSPRGYVRIWDRWIASGFVPDRRTFESLTAPDAVANQGACRIEAVPGTPYRFRAILQR